MPWITGLVVMALLAGVAITVTTFLGGGASDTTLSAGADVPGAPQPDGEAAEDEGDGEAAEEPAAPPVEEPETGADEPAEPVAAQPGQGARQPVVIQDTDRGTGRNRIEAGDDWKKCTTTCGLVQDGSYLWTSTTGAALTVRFTGTSIVLYGVTEPWSRIATVAIDGGTPEEIDFYTADQKLGKVFSSKTLPSGDHTLVLTMGPKRNPSSTGGDAITFDRAEVQGGPAEAATAPSTPKTQTPAKPVAPVAAGSTDYAGKKSGLPWMSGYFHKSHNPVDWQKFADWRGRPLDFAHIFSTRNKGWDALVEPAVFDKFSAFPRIVISQPMYPRDIGANNADCAAGKYDEYWKRFGRFLVSKNRADTIVRIGWEFNGTFTYWRVDADPTLWKQCFRRVALAIKSTDPQVRIDWTINAHGSPVPASKNPFDAYPGNDVVDIVGIDSYDHTRKQTDEASFDRQCREVDGLCSVIDFARKNNKKVSVGEWGVVTCGNQANKGMDNPLYIRKMFETFQAAKDVMAFEAYFEDPDQGNVCSVITNGGQAPKAAAQYRTSLAAAAS